MRAIAWLVPSALAAGAASLAADDDAADAARHCLRQAVERQGPFDPAKLEDVRLEFRGQVREESEHWVARTYAYRLRDRSFRLRTTSKADSAAFSERGVFGEDGFWDRDSKGAVRALSPGNESDEGEMDTIARERADFEDVLRLVFLRRLDDARSRVRFAEPATAKLAADRPKNPTQILGATRGDEYRVLVVERDGLPRITLYVHAGNGSVPKAVVHSRARPDEAAWVYYFGAYTKGDAATQGVPVPRLISIHREEPVDPESAERGVKAWGEVTITLNAGLEDADLMPASR